MKPIAIFQTDHFAVIKVAGQDSFRFLQGQFSNDLSRLDPGKMTYGLWLDHKGKVHADSFVLRVNLDAYLLLSYYCSAASIISKLDPFIIADDVDLSNLSKDYVLTSMWGKELMPVLDEKGLLDQPVKNFSTASFGCFFNGRRSSVPNLDILIPASSVPDPSHLLEYFAMDKFESLTVGAEEVTRERIESGIPSIPEDIGPTDLPQEGGLEVDAVSFSKGCYLGQEVMSRLQTRGKPRRCLYRVEAEGTLPRLNLPFPIVLNEKKTGQLRSAVSGGRGWVGLAMLPANHFDGNDNSLLMEHAGARIELVVSRCF